MWRFTVKYKSLYTPKGGKNVVMYLEKKKKTFVVLYSLSSVDICQTPSRVWRPEE